MTTGDPISVEEACAILGTSATQLLEYVALGRLAAGPRYQRGRFSRSAVEQLATDVLRPRRKLPPYWVTGHEAADVLGVSRSRLDHLARRGTIPYLTHRTGIRLYRRHQLAVIGNARLSRRLNPTTPVRSVDAPAGGSYSNL
jgi:predicted site-specific integrase-resolvase